MQFQCLANLALAVLLFSCVSQSSNYAGCDHDTLFTRGLKDGELGLNHVESIQNSCPSEQFEMAEENYLSGRKRGLKNFCNASRAQNRALLNLEIEEVCKDFQDYVVWFEKGLDEHCTQDLALKDSQSLKPSNDNCLKVETYNTAFRTELDSLCTKRWAYQQGYRELKLSSYCLETKQKDALILSHSLGLESRVKLENKRLEKKADRLNAEMKVLKKSKASSKEERREIKEQKDKVSRELLETLHALEQNKLKL
jgi:hypothetical protein